MAITVKSMTQSIKQKHAELTNHRIFGAVNSIADLRLFMEWHVFAVWDFMSLVKRLQCNLTSVSVPWTPPANSNAARLINEIVLGEESDETPKGKISHFDLYLHAMEEIGASTEQIRSFITLIQNGNSVESSLISVGAANPIQRFVNSTIEISKYGKPHQVVGNFFYGRENVIPDMFRSLLQNWNIEPTTVPTLLFYLERHIEVDSSDHGPAAESLIREITNDDQVLIQEVLEAGLNAIDERNRFWDGLENQITKDLKSGYYSVKKEAMEKLFNTESFPWKQPTGFDDGIEQFIVGDTLDQTEKNGIRTRFVRFAPGARTKVPFVHDYHEEVFLVEGDQSLLDKESLSLLDTYSKGAYFVRPAGTYHGPFSSNEGCLLMEVHYYSALEGRSS